MYQQQQYYPQQEEVVYEQPQQRRKFLRNPFKHQQPQQVVEESYESYPSEEEQYYEQPVYEQYEQPQQQQHFWNKHQRNVQQQQQQYYPEQGQYSTSSEEQDFGPAPMSWKKKVWNHSKPFIIKSGTTLLLSVLLPPKYVPMARNFIFKILGVPPSGVIPAQPSVRGGRFGGYEQAGAYPQQAYVGKRKVGKATFRKVLLLGGGLVATGLSALMAWRYLLKPKFGKNIYSTEPKALGKLEKDEEMDEQLAHQPSRMVERIKKSAFGIKGSPAVLEKRSRSKKYQEPEIHHEAYVDDSTRPALYGQLKNEMQSRNI